MHQSLIKRPLLLNKPIVFCIMLMALSACGCKFNPNLQGKGEKYLQGEWKQDTSVLQKKLLNYSLYRFKFTCDSFFVSMQSFSKANGGNPDSCVKNGQWSEYAKGYYNQQNDTLHLKGLFCNANYSYKDEGGCFRSGNYEEFFKIDKKSDSVFQFTPTSSVVPFSARLIKHYTCIPKPL